MEKRLLLLGFGAMISFFASTVYAQEIAEEEVESPLSITLSGEIDASVRNYTGTRFDTENGPENENSALARIPSMDLYMEYNFAPKWLATADVEFISGCGIQVDEISLSYDFNPSFGLKAGLFTLPIGYCNNGHSYLDYFMTGDPEGEYDMIPCPFSETGIAAYGELMYNISYQVSLTTAVNPFMFSSTNWIQGATQGFFSDEANFSSPAITATVNYDGIKNLHLGAGIYFTPNSAKNMSLYSLYKDFCIYQTGKKYSLPVTLWFAEAEYAHRYFTARASYLQGNLGNAQCFSDFINFLPEDVAEEYEIDYEGDVIGKQIISYMGEIGLNLKECFYPETNGPVLTPFVHYECYDSQHKVSPNQMEDRNPASKVRMWSVGMNWKPIENIAVKCNYTNRKLGSGGLNSMNEINLGIAYSVDF